MKTLCLMLIALISQVGELHTVHLDYGMDFQIKAEVYNKATNAPLANVKIIFIGLDLDSEISKATTTGVVGKTSDDGIMNVTYSYVWGETQTFQGEVKEFMSKYKTKKAFEIEFAKDGFKNKTFHFKVSELPLDKDSNKKLVNLGKVYLEPCK